MSDPFKDFPQECEGGEFQRTPDYYWADDVNEWRRKWEPIIKEAILSDKVWTEVLHLIFDPDYPPNAKEVVALWKEEAEKWNRASKYTNIHEIALENEDLRDKLEAVESWYKEYGEWAPAMSRPTKWNKLHKILEDDDEQSGG